MIKVEHLTKYYGNHRAVNDLSFEIEPGHVYGFLGPNGAGKSTTMNIITGCLSPTEGSIHIGAFDLFEEPEKAKKLIGYLPEQPPLYPSETPLEYLKFVGAAKGLTEPELSKQVNDVIEQTGLTKMKRRLISAMSKGYKQRVGIAQALLGNPEIIILDEPTVGLDPRQIIEIRNLIKKLGESHTVIFSSHILSEVQALCDQVLIIVNGSLAAYDEPENLERVMSGEAGIRIRALTDNESALKILKNADDNREYKVTEQDDAVQIDIKTDVEDVRAFCCDLFFAFADEKIPLFEMNVKKTSLEDVFIELTAGSDQKVVERTAEISNSEPADGVDELIKNIAKDGVDALDADKTSEQGGDEQ